MPYSAEAKQRAKRFVARVRRQTACIRCGRHPVEWHNSEHKRHSNRRVAGLVARGHPLDRIKREMRESTPLCRSCHMAIDGRAEKLTAARPRKKGTVIVPPLPCETCGKLTKPRWQDKCRHCYDAERRRKRRTRSSMVSWWLRVG